MVWTKTSDDYPDRLLDLSDAAYRLHHAATSLCNRLGLDGRLSPGRLVLVAVPPRTRRRAVIRELVDAGHWLEDEDGWILADFFDAQPTAEEVAARRDYDAARQAIRFAKTNGKPPETIAVLREREKATRLALFDVRARKPSISQRESQRYSQRPDPSRPDPSRPATSEDEDEASAIALSERYAERRGRPPCAHDYCIARDEGACLLA